MHTEKWHRVPLWLAMGTHPLGSNTVAWLSPPGSLGLDSSHPHPLGRDASHPKQQSIQAPCVPKGRGGILNWSHKLVLQDSLGGT